MQSCQRMSCESVVMSSVSVAPDAVDRAKSGDVASFAELVQTHQAEVLSFLYRMTAHRQDAEDLAQEFWLRVHKKLPAFEGRSSFRTWLFRVATNLARDHHRVRQRWPVHAQDLAKELAESSPETAAEFRRVEQESAHARFEIREHIDCCLTCIMKTLPLEQQLAILLGEMYGNMLVGVWKELLIARLEPDQGDTALLEPHVRKMDITGKSMKGWIMVEPEGIDDDAQLEDWIRRATKFVAKLPAK